MFSEKYRSDNEKIVPDEGLIQHLAVKMHDASGHSGRVLRGRLIRSAAAVTACVAITAVSFGLASRMNKLGFENAGTASDSTYGVKIENHRTDSYDSIYALVKGMRNDFDGRYGSDFEIDEDGVVEEDFEEAPANGQEAEATAGVPKDINSNNRETDSPDDYSGTNLQVDGVDEADVIKTDGRYIYCLTNGSLVIAEISKTQKGQLTKLSTTAVVSAAQAAYYGTASEMYLYEDRVIVMVQTGNNVYADMDIGGRTKDIAPYYGGGNGGASTAAVVYDITDRTKPALAGTFLQSGSCLSTRMTGSILYTVTNHYIYGDIDADKPETFVPTVVCGGKTQALTVGDIYIAENPQSTSYLTVSAVDVTEPEQVLSTKAVLGSGSTLYVNAECLITASADKMQEKEVGTSGNSVVYAQYNATSLMRFSLKNGEIALTAAGSVPGAALNQFSMDEKDGYLRIVTTVNRYYFEKSNRTNAPDGGEISGFSTGSGNGTTNALYVLDKDLKIAGKIEDVAQGESVYSVRFDGDVGYFVTFRRTDPLFTVDLTDPAKPKILSALKIPGFSEYLHPYSSGLLFGFGKNADEDSGFVTGLKLSMFDVSNPADVSERDKYVISDSFYSPASYNHKAILVSPSRGLIGFCTEGSYRIYSYSNSGFTLKASIQPPEDLYDKYVYDMDVRGLYIGDVFYIVTQRSIASYSMDGYTFISSIFL